jgi:hypothetical protein
MVMICPMILDRELNQMIQLEVWILARFSQEGFAPVQVVWSESGTAAAAPFWGFSDVYNYVDNCPEASVEIKKEIHHFLNTRKFRALKRYLDEKDEMKFKDIVPSSRRDHLRPMS